jgi:hypothetical protein
LQKGNALRASLILLVSGGVLVFAVLGIGNLAVWLLKLRTLPWYWRMAFAAILGQATVNLVVQLLLLSGGSSAPRLRILGWSAIVVGLFGHLLALGRNIRRSRPIEFGTNKFLKALLLLVWLTNLVVALAPSSKIDEVFYHMLVPKRIAADGGMNFYRLPIEAAVVPQMQYQISLSPAYALGVPEVGNVLSFSYSVVLGLFILGFIQDITGDETLALLGGLGCVAGLYQTVWHTTEGAAAIGELALVVATCGLLWPGRLRSSIRPLKYGFLAVTAASLAASTKISLLPLCTIVSLLAAWIVYREIKGGQWSAVQAGIVLVPWALMHLPLMVWTYHESGSFWGPVMANVFRPSIFPAAMLKTLDQMRIINQPGLLPNMRYAAVELSPLLLVGIIFTVWKALRGGRAARLVIAFLLFQGALILWLLPYEFRFLGGLLYIPLMATILVLSSTGGDLSQLPSLTPLGKRVVALRNWIAITAIVPWLLFQMYYARPFAEVAAGVTTRREFRERFVALARDYEVLNKILPVDAVLYIANGRVSLFDAPRPVVLTPLDLRQRTSIYRLTLKDLPEKETLTATSVLNCDQTVYLNDNAIVETYRIPGKVPKTGSVTVRSCRIEPADQATSGKEQTRRRSRTL